MPDPTPGRPTAVDDLAFALDAARAGVWSQDLATGEVRMDGRARALVRAAGPLTTASMLGRVHPEDRATAEAILGAAAAGPDGAPFEAEVRFHGDDGAWRWIGYRGRYVAGAGAAGSLAGLLFDVTALREAEALRAETRDDLDFVLGAVRVGTFSRDLATDVIDLDDRAREVLGIGGDIPYEAAMARVHPDDLGALLPVLGPVEEGTAESFAVDLRIRDDGGRWRWVVFRARRVDDRGEAGVIAGVVFDTTELREATDRARRRLSEIEAHFRSVPLVVSVLDLDGRFLRVNDQLAAFAGTTADALVGGTASERFPALAAITEPLIADVLASGEPRLGVPARAASPADPDDVRDWLLYVHPVLDRGEVVAVTVGSQDVTDLTRAQDELRTLTADLEARVAERTRQVRGLAVELTRAEEAERERIAHVLHDDLQQTLFGVQVQAKLLAGLLAEGAEADGEAGEILAQARAMLAEAILSARTLSAEFSPPVADDEGFGHSLVWLAHRVEMAHGVRVAVEGPDDLAVDPDLRAVLLRSLRELLFNVVKHADADEAAVRFEATDAEVRVEVLDGGAGFDPATVGGGFGLDSVRRRISLVGGELSVESSPGEGTRAVLTAPRSPAP